MERNLRLVVKIAQESKYFTTHLTFLDRVQEGNIGLQRAAEKFDPKRDNTFVTYATYWIGANITRAITNQERERRTPVDIHQDLTNAYNIIQKYNTRYGWRPNLDELKEELNNNLNGKRNISTKRVKTLVEKLNESNFSIDKPLYDNEKGKIGDIVVCQRKYGSEILIEEEIKKKLNSTIDEKEKDIITRYFGLDKENYGKEYTLEYISKEYGVTREAIRQTKEKALRKLRKTPKIKSLI